MNLKDQMFSQFATSGLSDLLKEFQDQNTPKKGMRFNKDNITYEIGAPRVVDSSIEYEISSKIPQDEIPEQEEKEDYFKKVKEIMLKESDKAFSVEMDNIVLDAEKDTEKKREYVKLVYRYPCETLYDEKKIIEEAKKIKGSSQEEKIPPIPGVMTIVGKLVLISLSANLSQMAKNNMDVFIRANDGVKKEMSKKS